jgi:hypothetical protein
MKVVHLDKVLAKSRSLWAQADLLDGVMQALNTF